MTDNRIKISADYQRLPTRGGSPAGVVKVFWPLWLKTALHLWALENVAGKDEHKFIYSPNFSKWSVERFIGFLPVLEKLSPEFYAELKAASRDERHMAQKAMQRHHKMFYQVGRGRQFSTEHPENQALQTSGKMQQYQLGLRAYAGVREQK
jgi:hypothetical protein